MTKDEMLKERDRLAKRDYEKVNGVKCEKWEDDYEAYIRGFNAARELIERERVKPLRDALKRIIASDTSQTDGLAERILAQVEEWE